MSSKSAEPKIVAMLVDDESNCTDLLRVMIERYCPEIEIASIQNDAEAALANLKANPPELLFLDIEMPMLNGFDLLAKLDSLPFRVIFTTAYDQYALRAFKFNALDYLLKPISREDLLGAVSRVRSSRPLSPEIVNAAKVLREQAVPGRIALPVGLELIFVDVKDILYCQSDGSYVSVFLDGQPKPYVLSKSLRELDDLLNNPTFFRAHNSYLINMTHIHKIVRSDGGEIVMRNGASLPIARSKRAELLGLIAKL